jgi:hypothetical protein
MSALLLAAWMVVAPGQDPNRKTEAQSSGQASSSHAALDGTWQVVYAEKDGRRMDSGASQPVTIRGDTMTCALDGKQRTFRLRFGPNQTVWVTEMGGTGTTGTERPGQTTGQPQTGGQSRSGQEAPRGGTSGETHQGVYIASDEYLCFGFQHAGAPSGGRTGAGTESGTTGTRTVGQAGGTTGAQTGTAGGTHGSSQFHKAAFALILRKSQAGK